MNHISVKLAFGRREKIFGGTKCSRRQKAYKKIEKKWRLFFCFLETVNCLWGAAKKLAGGAPNGNVTPLL